jgi:O-acetyl-ADP-ribose deacetylase (regulator of RNase III)
MPFGEKKDADGKAIDFDMLYEKLIRSAIEGPSMREAGGPVLECTRSDKIGEAGWVHRKMIFHIFHDDVAVVDLSTLNPNVFYELGVRHALRQSVTVLLRRQGTKTPFNIQGFSSIDYDPDDEQSLALARKRIAEHVAKGLRREFADSLVYEVLGETLGDRTPPQRLDPEPTHLFRLLKAARKRIGVLTGDLQHVQERIDIWVNSENTNMQMARFYERSGSAVIRYFGAKRDEKGSVVEDTIADELLKIMGSDKSVDPGSILVTSAGDLEKTYGVRRIFHAAAVVGKVGFGYRPVPDVESCITNALSKADSAAYAPEKLRSILFPLLGTGTGGAELKESIQRLVDTAINYFERKPNSVVSTAYFLAFTDKQRDACLSVLRHKTGVTELKSNVDVG